MKYLDNTLKGSTRLGFVAVADVLISVIRFININLQFIFLGDSVNTEL